MINTVKNFSENERIFLICDKCLWSATSINAFYGQKRIGNSNSCPVCKKDQLSRFPLKAKDFKNIIIPKM